MVKMKQPNKFECDVDSVIHGSYPTADTCITRDEAISLLNRYHNEMVELVKKEQRSIQYLRRKTLQSDDPRDHENADRLHARVVQCADILILLKELKQHAEL